LTAAEICGWAAIFEGFHVKKSEVHGMAQRGGSVESHLRFGERVFSPLIPMGEADFLVAFYRQEGRRLKGYLKPAGLDLTDELENAAKIVHEKKYMNIFLLGVLSRHLSIKEASWLKAVERVFRNKNLEENKKIFCIARGAAL